MSLKYRNLDKAQRDYVRSLPRSVRKLVATAIRQGKPFYDDRLIADRKEER